MGCLPSLTVEQGRRSWVKGEREGGLRPEGSARWVLRGCGSSGQSGKVCQGWVAATAPAIGSCGAAVRLA